MKGYSKEFWADFEEFHTLRENGKYTNIAIYVMRSSIRSMKTKPDFKGRLLEKKRLLTYLIDIFRESLSSLSSKNKKEIKKSLENITFCEFALHEINEAISSLGRKRVSPQFKEIAALAEQLEITEYSPKNANRIHMKVKNEMDIKTVKRNLQKILKKKDS